MPQIRALFAPSSLLSLNVKGKSLLLFLLLLSDPSVVLLLCYNTSTVLGVNVTVLYRESSTQEPERWALRRNVGARKYY